MNEEIAKKATGFAKILAWLTAIAGVLWAIPQQKLPELFKDGAKAAYHLARVGKRLTEAGIELAWTWLKKYGLKFLAFVVLWTVFAVATMIAGILMRNHGIPQGKVVGVLGTILLQLLFVFLAVCGGALAKVLLLANGTFERLLSDAPKNEIKKELHAAHEKYKNFLMAALVLSAGLLLPFQLLVSWSALAGTVLLWGALMPAIFGIIYLGGNIGLGVRLIVAASIALASLILFGLLAAAFVPEFYAMLNVRAFGIWLTRRSSGDVFLGIVGLILFLVFLIAALTKDKEQRSIRLEALVWLSLIALGLTVFLVIRGTLAKDDVLGKGASIDWKFWGDDSSSSRKGEIKPADKGQPVPPGPIGRYSGGTYLAAPAEDVPVSTPDRTPSRAPRVVVQTKPLPPKPAPKAYRNDPGAATRDLKALLSP